MAMAMMLLITFEVISISRHTLELHRSSHQRKVLRR